MSNKISILHVDDEPLYLQLFKINFSSKYNVIIAESGHKNFNVL